MVSLTNLRLPELHSYNCMNATQVTYCMNATNNSGNLKCVKLTHLRLPG